MNTLAPPALTRRALTRRALTRRALARHALAGAAPASFALAPFAPAPFASPARAATPPALLELGVARDIAGPLDPVARLGAPEANILRAVCPGLVAEDGSGRLVLALAARLATPDPRRLVFTLREGLRFHDGFGPITAEDVRFSYERFREKGPDGALPPYAADWAVLEGVEVTGPLSGILHLRAPSAMLWRTVLPDASGAIISRRALEAGLYRPGPGPLRAPGGGALRLGPWRPWQSLDLLAAAAGTPFPALRLRPVPEAKTAELAVRAAEIAFAAVPPEDLPALGGRPGLRLLARPATNLVWIGVNAAHPRFADPRVREAVACALDVGRLVEGAWNGACAPAVAAIAPALPGAWAAPPPRRDVARARALLRAAGKGEGFAARLLLMNTPAHQRAAVLAQAMLAEAGIRLTLDIRDPGAFWSAGSKAQELVLQRFGGKPDPGFLLQWFTAAQIGGWNWQGFRDPEFDALVARAAAMAEGEARAALYVAAQQRMAASFCFVFLTHETVACAYRDWLRPAVLANGEDWLLDRFARA